MKRARFPWLERGTSNEKGWGLSTASWMSGYVADVTYTLGFYRELAPSFLHLTSIVNGVEGLKLAQPLRYCDLGCGRGYGTVLLAAANPDFEFVGIDFNPSHVAEARGLASRANVPNVAFYETGFGDAARSSDPKLSNFDVIGIHGVYSWVVPQVRGDIHQFIRDKLLAGGLVYNSYNTLPGWATAMPIQHLIMEHAQRSTRDSIKVVDEAFALLNSLVEHKSAFVMQNPGVKARLERMGKQDKVYLAHEFINEGWEALYVTQAMANFAEAKLTYVGSASLIENRIDLCVPKDLQGIVGNAPDIGMRELLKDYVANKQFRRDVCVKGPQQLSQRDQRQRFAELAFADTTTGKELPEKFQLPIGEIALKKETVAALLSAIGGKVCTGSELLAAGARAGLREPDTMLMILLLVNAGTILPARPDHAEVDRGVSHRLNGVIMEMTVSADTHRFLASPVLGSAIAVPFVDRIIGPDAVKQPQAGDSVLARRAFERLEAVGQSFRRDGKVLEKTPESIGEIAKLVTEFRELRLPRWRSLGAVAA
jgi:SAM-dependent methyltransferase